MRSVCLMTFRRVMLVLFAALGATWLAVVPVNAASTTVDTTLRLSVDPVDCTIDIVQNGSGQTLQIPAHSCLPIVSVLLTPTLDQAPQALPPTAQLPSLPVVILTPRTVDGEPWAPTVSTSLVGESLRSSSGTIPAMLAGIGTVAAVTTIGVDAALFELSHSKSAARWARARFHPGTKP